MIFFFFVIKPKKVKNKNLTVTLERKGGTLGIAMAGNEVTAVHKATPAFEAGLLVGDVVREVNGKDTGLEPFASLIPKDKTKPIKLRIVRVVEVDEEAEEEARKERAIKKAKRDAEKAAAAAAAEAEGGGEEEGGDEEEEEKEEEEEEEK